MKSAKEIAAWAASKAAEKLKEAVTEGPRDLASWAGAQSGHAAETFTRMTLDGPSLSGRAYASDGMDVGYGVQSPEAQDYGAEGPSPEVEAPEMAKAQQKQLEAGD